MSSSQKKNLHWQTCYFLDFWHFKQIVSKKFSNEKNWKLRIIIIIIIILLLLLLLLKIYTTEPEKVLQDFKVQKTSYQSETQHQQM